MTRKFVAAALCLGLLVTASGPAGAQPASVDKDRILRPGDKIEWTTAGPHRVRFGGSVSNPKKGEPDIQLTPWVDIDKLLTFSPALKPDANGVAMGPQGQLVTATVKKEAGAGVTFTFTCGVHPGAMLSQPFKLEAASGNARTVKLRATPKLQWVLLKDDGTEVTVDTTP